METAVSRLNQGRWRAQYLSLGGAQPAILAQSLYMFMNIKAWGPQVKYSLFCNE